MKRFLSRGIAASVALAALTAGVPADAVTFVLNDTGGAGQGSQARKGFEIAAAYWSSVLTNNVVITVNVGMADLGERVLGATAATTAFTTVDSAYAGLAANRSGALDNIAVANLQTRTTGLLGYGALTYTGNGVVANPSDPMNPAAQIYTDSFTRLDNDGSLNNVIMTANMANIQALGLTSIYGTPIPISNAGSIQFSTRYGFDYDPTNGIDSNGIDFVGVAIHELGHLLGITSVVDYIDYFTYNQTDISAAGELYGGTIYDLFRYSAPGQLDWSTQNVPYFSIDGGKSQMFGNSLFSTGTYEGDGTQATHWKDNLPGQPQLGIFDPTVAFGQQMEVSALDLAALDAIGWNINFDVLANPSYRATTAQIGSVPEPMTWVQMIAGFGMLGGAMRYRRRRTLATVAV